jgi:monoamine oxidase
MQDFDVVVVGGGISGIYCAWRLITTDFRPKSRRQQDGRQPPDSAQFLKLCRLAQRRGGRLRVALFELDNRIGGRLLSVIPPDMPHIRCELGGMRYTTAQPYIRSLVETELNLKTREFAVDRSENIAYLRQDFLRKSDLQDPKKIPYHLTTAEKDRQSFSPGALLTTAIEQVIPGATTTSGKGLEKLLRGYKLEGKRLYEHGFWNILARSISAEAYRFIFDTSGYDTIGLNWNAVNTILLNFRDFGKTVDYRAVTDGYEAVPHSLHNKFLGNDGKVFLKHRLQSLTKQPDGRVMLKFNPAAEDTREVCADHVILAMPRRSLELLDQNCDLFHHPNPEIRKRMRRDIRSVTPVPLFKMFVCYPGPWWRAAGVSKGQSVTDLPLRQCYYWGVEGDQALANSRNRNAVMLATYDDSRYVRFWAALRHIQDKRDKLREYSVRHWQAVRAMDRSPADEREKWNKHLASVAMTKEIHRQLQEMHGLKFVPEYFSAVYKNWGGDPFGGGVNFWKIGSNSFEVIPRMLQPNPRLNVYVCGEAYSNNQGWVEGALETAEMVLKEKFGLAKPTWVP